MIELRKCQECGHVQGTSHARCVACDAEALGPLECAPRGHIVSYTNCRALPPVLQDHERVTFAIVALECGGRVLTQVWPPESVVMGTPVRGRRKTVHMTPAGDKIKGWVFSRARPEE